MYCMYLYVQRAERSLAQDRERERRRTPTPTRNAAPARAREERWSYTREVNRSGMLIMVMIIYSALVRSHQSTYEGGAG